MGARIINRRLVNQLDYRTEEKPRAFVKRRSDGKFAVQFVYPQSGRRISKILTQEQLNQVQASGDYLVFGSNPHGRRRNPSELVSVQEKIDALVERINLTGGTASQLLRLQDLKKRRDALEGLEEVDIPESHYRTAEEIERESRRKGSYRGTYNPAASEMSASDINRRLDRLDAESSKLTRQFIDAGRGNERMSEIAEQTDPLSMKWNAVQDEYSALRREVSRRYGPGAPSRLPRGFGPIRARF